MDRQSSGLTSDAGDRRRALVAGYSGDVSTLEELFGSADPTVRAAALGGLERSGNLALELLVAALSDSAWQVRRRACEIAGTKRRDPAPIPDDLLAPVVTALSEILADEEPLVSEAASWALGELVIIDRTDGEDLGRAVEKLGAVAANHKDPLCREAAVAALGSIGDPSSLQVVLDALDDKPPIRRRAAAALAAFDDPKAEAALQRCLTDRDWQVRQAAEDLLGIAGTE
jgi:HEAT repeat protein